MEPGQDLATVLVVDDERGPRESVQVILKPHFRLLAASGGEEAIEVLRRERVDVVTLDVKMPGMSGPDTLARIREIDPDIEVVIVTGYGSFDSAIEVLRLRAFDYIAKPFESRRILDVVRRAVETRRARRPGGEIEEMIPPLSEIVDDVERWQRNVTLRLGELDRATLDRILGRLRTLRNQIRERLRALSRFGSTGTDREER